MTTLLQSSGIYSIRNAVSGRVYVGAARVFGERWRDHRKLLRAGNHHAIRLQRSWDKHGEVVFLFAVIEVISRDAFANVLDFRNAMKQREQYWIDVNQAASKEHGFNSLPRAFSLIGSTWSAETRANQLASWTPERRAAQAADRSEQKLSADHILAFGHANRGKVRTPEQRAKISAARKGKKASPETKAKLSAAGMGRKHTDKWRKNMSIAAKARIAAMSPARRAQLLAPLNTPQSIAKRGPLISAALRARVNSVLAPGPTKPPLGQSDRELTN
jgi:group I intron endonuclease